jgi:hypothetical protein
LLIERLFIFALLIFVSPDAVIANDFFSLVLILLLAKKAESITVVVAPVSNKKLAVSVVDPFKMALIIMKLPCNSNENLFTGFDESVALAVKDSKLNRNVIIKRNILIFLIMNFMRDDVRLFT